MTKVEDPIEVIKLLRRRVNVIPASLVLAQAANESGWGTSRFARQGNNLFGLWCYTENCGIEPARRQAGAKHQVAAFDNVEAGIKYYFYTINSHPAYRDLRIRRENLIASGQAVTGIELASGLMSYSERGQAYVDEIRAMIRVNQLQQLTQPAT